MEWRFQCGAHGDYREPNSTNVFVAVGMVSSIAHLSREERKKLFDRINEYAV